MLALCYTYAIPMLSLCYPYAIPMLSLCYHYAITMLFLCYPLCYANFQLMKTKIETRLRRKMKENETYDIGCPAVLLTGDGFQRHPFDGSVLVVSKAMVITREQITRQCRIAQFHFQLVVDPAIATQFSHHHRKGTI